MSTTPTCATAAAGPAAARSAVVTTDLEVLRVELRRLGPLVVAFSGGADSAFLAWMATDELGADRVLCVTAVSPSLAPEELADCRALAAEWGLAHREVATSELADPSVRGQRRQPLRPLQVGAHGSPRPARTRGRR